MNLRPSGYEPDELPDCSTPQLFFHYHLSSVVAATTFGTCRHGNPTSCQTAPPRNCSFTIIFHQWSQQRPSELVDMGTRRAARLLHPATVLSLSSFISGRSNDLRNLSTWEPDELPDCSTPQLFFRYHLSSVVAATTFGTCRHGNPTSCQTAPLHITASEYYSAV